MQTSYDERTRQDADDYRLLQKATSELEGILGASSDSANAQWDLQDVAR